MGRPHPPSATRDDGRPLRRKVAGVTRKEVAEKLRDLSTDVDAGSPPRRADLTVGQFHDTGTQRCSPTPSREHAAVSMPG